MRDDYLNDVIRRGNTLNMLEQALSAVPSGRFSAVRWVVAAAFGLLVTLLPSVCTAQSFLYIT